MDFIKDNAVIITIIIVILVVLVVLFWDKIKKTVKQLNKNSHRNNNLNNKTNHESKAVFVFFHMKNCKYCKEMKPEWEKLKKKGSHNGCKFVDYTAEENDDLITKHKVYSFPTLKLCLDGVHNPKNCKEFEGKRSADAMISFIEENL